MEHIVQFAVSIDDKRIQEITEESAAKQVAEEIKIASHGMDWNNRVKDKPEKLRELFQEEVEKIVKENYDKIIDGAIEKAVSRIMLSKKVRESINNALEE